jgi:hypothetical protein
LLDAAKRPSVVTDLNNLVETQVDGKGGVSGLAVKGTFKLVKAIKPGIIENAVDDLLDNVVKTLDPYYAKFQGEGAGSLADYFVANQEAISNELLAVTDARAESTSKDAVKKAYSKLRPSAQDNVKEALPGLAGIILKHA